MRWPRRRGRCKKTMMRSCSQLALVLVALLTGCHIGETAGASAGGASSGLETSGTTGAASASSGGETGVDGCSAEQFAILGHCYRRVDFPAIRWTRTVAAADMDDDGRTDLVMTCDGVEVPQAVCMLRVNTDASVVRKDVEWLGGPLPFVGPADFDADGIADVLVSNLYKFAVYSLGPTGFEVHSEFVFDPEVHDPGDAWVYPALPIDLEQDGRAEIVAGSSFNGFRVLRFDGGASQWVPSGERYTLFGCGNIADAKVADLDGDGAPELLAIGSHNDCDANMSPGTGWNRVSVFTANGSKLVDDGSFPAELAARRLEVADFDGDKRLDLLVAADEDMMLFRGKGDRSFAAPLPIPGMAKFYGSGPRAGDFDLDGTSEILVEQEDYLYSLLVGLPAPAKLPMPEHINAVELLHDVDEDGRPDFVTIDAPPDQEYHLVLTLSGPP